MSATAEFVCQPCDIGAHEGCRNGACSCCSGKSREQQEREHRARRRAGAERALRRFVSASRAAWVDRLVAFIAELGPGERFSTDRLWWVADEIGLSLPEDRRAMGSVISKAQGRKLIRLDAEHPPHRSVRPECHGRFVSVWIRVGPAPGPAPVPSRPTCACGATGPPARCPEDGRVLLVCLACGFERPEGPEAPPAGAPGPPARA